MNKERLLRNIIDQIKEAQIKLGYDRESIRLYYPLDSLNRLVDTQYETVKEICMALIKAFEAGSVLGDLEFAVRAGRIEVCVPPEGSEYVHTQVASPAFLEDMIQLFRTHHHCTLEEIRSVFEKYSADYICEQMPEDAEFDYVMHFNDINIDEYYYCIKMEMGHTIYHRFTKEDYALLI